MTSSREGKIAAVILAAGQGKRMKSSLPKVLHEILGRPILSYVLESARRAGADQVVVVAGGATPGVEELARSAGSDVVVQRDPQGTGDAVAKARPILDRFQGEILVLCGDAPLITAPLISRLVELHRREGYKATILTAHLPDPTGFGRIVRGKEGQVTGIIEEADATESQREIDEVNTGAFCFSAEVLFPQLQLLKCDNKQGEFYLTDVVEALVFAGEKVGALSMGAPKGPLGINTKDELLETERVFRSFD